MERKIKLIEKAKRESKSSIKAIFFDVGDTLITIHPSVGAIYSTVCKEFGLDLDPIRLQNAFGVGWRRFEKLVKSGVNRYRTFPGGEREWWFRLVCDVLKSCDVDDIDPSLPDAIQDAFTRAEAWHVYPEATDVLRRLKSSGFKLVVISNWDSRLFDLLDLLKLKGYFDFILASFKEDVEKPSARIFRKALDLAQVLPFEAIHIGDRLEEDCKGAGAAGVKPLLIDRKKKHNGYFDTIESRERVFKFVN